MRSKVFVVEGRNDANKLKRIFPDIAVVTTNGSALNIESVELLKELDATHDIILFLDPDHAGERIRRLLSREVKNIYHAFLDKELAYSKNRKKIGIEHASEKDILEALKDIKIVSHESTSDITHTFLFDMKLTGNKDSKLLREKLYKALKIGYVNGKTLYQRLRMFDINKKDVIEVLK